MQQRLRVHFRCPDRAMRALRELLSEQVDVIPGVGRGESMNSRKPPVVVAEVGCNHMGKMDLAREMIVIAATFAKCGYVKFQKRNNRELLTPEEYAAPHPNPMHAYGASYGEHREYLEFDLDQHRQLQRWCSQFGIGYACSVWDLTSAREIAVLQPDYIKIPSACNLRFDMLRELARNFRGDLHIP